LNYKKVKQYWENNNSKDHPDCDEKGYTHYAGRIKELISLTSNEDVLDVGCGEGLIDFHLKKHCKSLQGFDVTERKTSLAKKNNPEIKYWQQSFLEEYKYKNFDKIFSFSVMQYCKPTDIDNFLDNSFAAVKKEGTVFHLDVPDREKMKKYYFRPRKITILKKMAALILYVQHLLNKNALLFMEGSYWHDLKKLKKKYEKKGIIVKINNAESIYRSNIIFYM